jgi:hypothetical protein
MHTDLPLFSKNFYILSNEINFICHTLPLCFRGRVLLRIVLHRSMCPWASVECAFHFFPFFYVLIRAFLTLLSLYVLVLW